MISNRAVYLDRGWIMLHAFRGGMTFRLFGRFLIFKRWGG